jgi:tRNA-specific 2-thiouridylase
MSRTLAVAISGGIDSMVAAHLLKEQGHEVFAVHFLTGFERTPENASPGPGATPRDIHAVGSQLGIPVHRVDLRQEFQRHVVDYFSAGYCSGETPNPCIVCNPRIKFGALLRYAQAAGAEALATGHYARAVKDACGRFRLYKGADPHKDQSYFLARLAQDQLARAIFPLAGLTKVRVREIAARRGLRPSAPEESQDVCFIREGSYRDFLSGPAKQFFEPGLIEDMGGTIIGEHPGLHAFTIGQRRGINCPAAEPYYVVRRDIVRNRLVVGAKKDLLAAGCRLVRINWIAPPPQGPIRVHTRLRYRTREIPSTLTPTQELTALVTFDTPQAAVSPGQTAVVYDGEEVLGGGFIAPG